MALYRETILFVDEEELFCEGLLKHFMSQSSFEVVGVATDWVEVLSKAEKLRPDIIVINMRVMHSDWVHVARSIRDRQPDTTIIAVCESTRNASEAVRAGVNAILGRDMPFVDILRIIGSVTEKSALVFDGSVEPAPREAVREEKNGLVSKREKEILLLLSKGLQNKEIASRLSIRIPTVNNHLYNIFRKLGCSNRTEAIFEAVKQGVIGREV
jgi:two-component system response regulator DegU